mmetsp:Transcript_786/g.2429  ORF Transcript_786/g.2429 Transcript_786/m.2429 type:complete len:238 (-) Transcript_786:518-1231(-)
MWLKTRCSSSGSIQFTKSSLDAESTAARTPSLGTASRNERCLPLPPPFWSEETRISKPHRSAAPASLSRTAWGSSPTTAGVETLSRTRPEASTAALKKSTVSLAGPLSRMSMALVGSGKDVALAAAATWSSSSAPLAVTCTVTVGDTSMSSDDAAAAPPSSPVLVSLPPTSVASRTSSRAPISGEILPAGTSGAMTAFLSARVSPSSGKKADSATTRYEFRDRTSAMAPRPASARSR